MATMKIVTKLGLLLQLLQKLSGAIELSCGATRPTLPSSMTCLCTRTAGNGIDWISSGTLISNCLLTSDCLPQPNGYTFSINTTTYVYNMTISSYSYSDCHQFTCKDVSDSSIQQTKTASAIEFDSTTPTDITEPASNYTNGNITITTNCISGYSNLNIKWYKRVGALEEPYTPDPKTVIYDLDTSTCTSCNNETAATLTVGFTHEEAVGSDTQEASFKVVIYHPDFPFDTLDRKTENVYTVKGNQEVEDDIKCRNTCANKIPATFAVTCGILILIITVPGFICMGCCKWINTYEMLLFYTYFPFMVHTVYTWMFLKNKVDNVMKGLCVKGLTFLTILVDPPVLFVIIYKCHEEEICSFDDCAKIGAIHVGVHVALKIIILCVNICNKNIAKWQIKITTEASSTERRLHESEESEEIMGITIQREVPCSETTASENGNTQNEEVHTNNTNTHIITEEASTQGRNDPIKKQCVAPKEMPGITSQREVPCSETTASENGNTQNEEIHTNNTNTHIITEGASTQGENDPIKKQCVAPKEMPDWERCLVDFKKQIEGTYIHLHDSEKEVLEDLLPKLKKFLKGNCSTEELGMIRHEIDDNIKRFEEKERTNPDKQLREMITAMKRVKAKQVHSSY